MQTHQQVNEGSKRLKVADEGNQKRVIKGENETERLKSIG